MSGSSSYETRPGTEGSGPRTVTAMFQSRTDAERAVSRLVDEGFRRDDVRLMPGSERDVPSDAVAERRHSEGFWESLADFFFPDSDRDVYAEGLSRGGFLVSVSTTIANHDRAIDILDDDGTIDLDEQETSWRSQGWSGRSGNLGSGSSLSDGPTFSAAGGAGARTAGSMPRASDRMAGSSLGALDGETDGAGGSVPGMDSETRTPGLAGNQSTSSTTPDSASPEPRDGSRTGGIGSPLGDNGPGPIAAPASPHGARDGDRVIPLAEEDLRVGKRDVEGGRVRVRSYVVETPVEQQVALRREHVDVRRRPVDRPLGAGDDAFRERTVELEERSEQPVVSKEARIREEVVLDKNVDMEQRTVSDTVRRTEVDIDDQRADAAKRRSGDGSRKI